MRSEVIASSSHEHLVLYDPAAIPLETPLDPDLQAQDPMPLSESAIGNLAAQGHALILRIAHEDCQANLRLLVEETAEPFLRDRAVQVIDGAILQIPSGKLTVDGVEFLSRTGETRSHSEAVSIEIPAGNYEVQVLNLMPWKGRHRTAEINKRTTKADRLVGKVVGAYTWLGVLLVPANILVAPAAILVAWLALGWRQALALAGLVLIIDLVVIAGFWVLDFASRWVPTLERVNAVAQAFDADNPDVEVLPEIHRFLDAVVLPWLEKFADCGNVRNALAADDGWVISLRPWEIVAALDILSAKEVDLIAYFLEQRKKASKWVPSRAQEFDSFVRSISSRLPPDFEASW